MSNEIVPDPASGPPVTLLERLGLSGKLLGFGALAGVLSAFLPLFSVSLDFLGQKGSASSMVVSDWKGGIGLAGYVAAGFLTLMLYPPTGRDPRQKTFCWAALGAGALVTLMAFWLLFVFLNASRISGGSGDHPLAAVARGMGITPGIGLFSNCLSAAAVAAGSVLKAREAKLV